MKLDAPSDAKPVVLYDGGDLGISDCKRMQLSYLSWTAEVDANSSDSDGDGGGSGDGGSSGMRLWPARTTIYVPSYY